MVEIELIQGYKLLHYIDKVAEFRLKYFKDYPYLYDGNYDIEKEYLDSFKANKDALITIGTTAGNVVAISTAVSLVSEFKIVQDAEQIFTNAKELFYFGEIIIAPEFRGQGLASRIFKLQEQYAKEQGYTGTCFLSIIREEGHPLKPIGYKDNDAKWEKLGYSKTGEISSFNWPTIMANGTTLESLNALAWWMKKI